MINLTLDEWCNKFMPVNFWHNGPTDIALEQYPYFYIDLLAAWEKSKQVGAREILNEMTRRWESKSIPVYTGEVYWMGEYPEDIVPIEVTDEGR